VCSLWSVVQRGARQSGRLRALIPPQASNVLLARCSGAAAATPVSPQGPGQRCAAKVSDFGLSLHLDPEATHVSRTHAGTLTHMSPELLLAGRASKASDVYAVSAEGREGQSGGRTARQQRAPAWPPRLLTPPAPHPALQYGILLWELLTGGHAFEGIASPLLCVKVVRERWRPAWPPGVCPALKALAEACWSPTAAARWGRLEGSGLRAVGLLGSVPPPAKRLQGQR
jgi:serine/threonine protein kinase